MWKSNNSKMHGLSEIGPNVPAFLIKLWKLVNDPETDELISWSESQLSFIIHNPAKFASELLSMYYKHNNMASFIRQLNMYGFHKIVSEASGLKNDKDWMEFAHQYFIKDHAYLLENIKRKLPNPKTGVISNEQFTSTNVSNGSQSEILAKVLSDVNNLKGKQESWDARLASMKRENEALWRELAIFRQKHLKQEQIINRLIHFIVTMVQPSRNVPLRRRYQLMLNDTQPVKKITKLSGADTSNINQGSPTGPTIHEIDTTDIILGNTEEPEVLTSDVEFISSDITEDSPTLIEVDATEASNINNQESENVKDNIPEDWLEVGLTEGDIFDPLTPINPAEVNPAVAAATLQHFEGKNTVSQPISITIPSFSSSQPGKKKVIYLTDENLAQNSFRKKKPVVLKLDVTKRCSNEGRNVSSLNSNRLDVALKSNKTQPRQSFPAKLSSTAIKRIIPSKSKALKVQSKTIKKDSELGESQSNSAILKLDSLYNGNICDDQLMASSKEESGDGNLDKDENPNSSMENDKISLSDLVTSSDLTSKDQSQNVNVLDFDPQSMAVVCQQPSTESLARELSNHVDSMQGEIDYLKEMLKGEGYSFDANNLPWLFNDDPLSYGVLPAMDEEANEKKNEEAGLLGNEIMTYGAPNLMDLVDMIGSTPSSQDWSNVVSPTSPALTDLATPAPSPSTFSFSSPAKRRKK